MGAGASSHRFSPAEVAASVRELGAAYQQYGNAVEDNAVSGRVVARSLADGAVDALLDDIGIAKRLHRDVITDLAHQHAGTLCAAAQQQLSPVAREPSAAPAAPARASPAAAGNRHLWAGDAVAAALRWPDADDSLARPYRGFGGGGPGRAGSGVAAQIGALEEALMPPTALDGSRRASFSVERPPAAAAGAPSSRARDGALADGATAGRPPPPSLRASAPPLTARRERHHSHGAASPRDDDVLPPPTARAPLDVDGGDGDDGAISPGRGADDGDAPPPRWWPAGGGRSAATFRVHHHRLGFSARELDELHRSARETAGVARGRSARRRRARRRDYAPHAESAAADFGRWWAAADVGAAVAGAPSRAPSDIHPHFYDIPRPELDDLYDNVPVTAR